MLNYQRVFLSHWLYHVKKLEDRRKKVPSARKMIALGEPVPLDFSERIRYMDYGHRIVTSDSSEQVNLNPHEHALMTTP